MKEIKKPLKFDHGIVMPVLFDLLILPCLARWQTREMGRGV